MPRDWCLPGPRVRRHAGVAIISARAATAPVGARSSPLSRACRGAAVDLRMSQSPGPFTSSTIGRRARPNGCSARLLETRRCRIGRGPVPHAALERRIWISGRRADAGRQFARALEAALAASDRSEAGWARLATGDMHYQDGHVDRARADWELSRSDFVAAGDANGEFEVVDDIENSIPGLERRPYAERCLAIAREQQDPLLEARARERWGGGLARRRPARCRADRAGTRGLGDAAARTARRSCTSATRSRCLAGRCASTARSIARFPSTAKRYGPPNARRFSTR